MKFIIIFLSVIFTVKSEELDAATKLVLDQISGGDANLLSDNSSVYDMKKEVTFFLTNRYINQIILYPL